MKADFLTPVGRLVQGDPFEAQTKNKAGQPLVTKSGQPTQRYFIAVAFPKTDPAFSALYAKLVEVARASFPHLFNAQDQCTNPKFSWKIADGDGYDDDGKLNANKPGFAGCWVLKFSSSFPPKCFHAGRYQPHEQIQDPKAFPRGYYVRVAGTIEGNGDASKPGLYVNLNMVELAGGQPSDIIVSGPDASAVFVGSAPVLPAGVAAPVLPASTPAARPGAMPGALPGAAPVLPAAMPGALPGAAPFPGAAPAAAPSVPNMNVGAAIAGNATTYPSNPAAPVAVPPNPAFLAGPGGAPQMPGSPALIALAPAPAMVAAGPQMTAKAGGFTYEQYRAQGWSDEQLRAEGMMV